jgi:hypothetical protein
MIFKKGKTMPTITDLKDKIDTKTINLLLLNIATMGIYQILWLYKTHRIIDSITKTRTADDTFVIWLAVCVGLGSYFIRTNDSTLITLGIILSIAASVLLIIWAFKARESIQEYILNEHKIDMNMSGFYTFMFTIFYINYCINDLPESYRKQQILSGKMESVSIS